MRIALKVLLILLVGSSVVIADTKQMRPYEVKSGKITYKLRGSGNVMGADINSSGTKVLIFDEYGTKSLIDQTKKVIKRANGKTTVETQHVITYSDGQNLYVVDFEQNRIVKMQNTTAPTPNIKDTDKKDKHKSIDEIMVQMGAQKVGTEKILGYSCDIWKIMENKQYFYKGIALKIDTHIMGMEGVMEASKVEFDIVLDEDAFELPDFPLYDALGKKLKGIK